MTDPSQKFRSPATSLAFNRQDRHLLGWEVLNNHGSSLLKDVVLLFESKSELVTLKRLAANTLQMETFMKAPSPLAHL